MAERRLILHLGGFKSGSTVIQRTLAAARHRIAAAGIIYPGFASNHGLVLYPLLAGLADRIARHPYGGIRTGTAARRVNDRVEADFKAALHATPDETLTVLSGEHFVALSPAMAARFVGQLRHHFDDIRAVCYLRAPLSFATSMVQQLVRDGATLAQAQTDSITPRYRACLEPWDTALGRDAVQVRLYHPEVHPVGDFSLAIGRPDLAATLMAAIPPGAANSALSAAAVAVIDRVNALWPGGYGNPGRAMRIDRFAGRLGGPRFVLDGATASRVREASAEELAWLSERLGRTPFGEEQMPTDPPAKRCHAAELERLARRMNALGLKRQNRHGERLILDGLADGDEERAWEGIPLLAEESAALGASAALKEAGWLAAAREAARQALHIAPQSAAATIAFGVLAETTA